MGSLDVVHFGLCALSAAGWATAAGWRAPGGTGRAAARGLLGGGAAFGVALGAYAALEAGGVDLAWERVLAGGWPAARLVALIGLVEEGAKLAGIALAMASAPTGVAQATVAVAATFAALETGLAFAGGGLAAAGLARVLLAPVAHALLSAPLGLALASARGRPRARAAARILAGLATAAALHAAADLALALPGYGRLGYAAALLAPVLWIYLHLGRARRVDGRPALDPRPAPRGA